MKKAIQILIGIIILTLIVYTINYFYLQLPLREVINDDYRNSDVKVNAHFENYINFNVLVFNLKEVGDKASKLDVFRTFMQYAEKIQSKQFKRIVFSYKGKQKFYIEGGYFKKLGDEYSYQNPMYIIRTFPENVYNLDGSKAFSSWTGGLFGVMNKQMEEFNEFMDQWFMDDIKSSMY